MTTIHLKNTKKLFNILILIKNKNENCIRFIIITNCASIIMYRLFFFNCIFSITKKKKKN